MKAHAFVLAVGFVLCVTAGKGYAASNSECTASDGNCQPQACQVEDHACSGTACTSGCCSRKPLQGRISTDVAARLSAGSEAIKRGRFETAANCYQYVLRQDPHNAEALYGTGYLAEKNGQLPHAAMFYRMAAINDPGNAHYMASLHAVQRQMNVPVVPVSTPEQQAPIVTAPTMATPCPNLCVATNKTKKEKFFKAVGTVGKFAIRTAASNAGLHCPVCRVLP